MSAGVFYRRKLWLFLKCACQWCCPFLFIFAPIIKQDYTSCPKDPKKQRNKALHTKLLNGKKSKLQEEKKEKAVRLKALVAKMNQPKTMTNMNVHRLLFIYNLSQSVYSRAKKAFLFLVILH